MLPLRFGRTGIGRRGKQWVIERNASVAQPDDAGAFRRSQVLECLRTDDGFDELERRMGGRGSDEQRTPRPIVKAGETAPKELAEARRQLDGLARERAIRCLPCGTRELERVERIAAGGVMDLAERWPVEGLAGTLAEQALERPEAERTDPERGEPTAQGAIEIERRQCGDLRPRRREDGNRLIP